MSNCWAWGVQQRLASSPCAALVTQYVGCCRQAGWDARERLDQKFVIPDGGAEALPCEGELTQLRRCLPKALLGGKGRPFEACERDFRAVAMLSAEDGESEKDNIVEAWLGLLEKGISAAGGLWPRLPQWVSQTPRTAVPSCSSSKERRGQRALDILVAAKVLSLPLVEKRSSANSQAWHFEQFDLLSNIRRTWLHRISAVVAGRLFLHHRRGPSEEQPCLSTNACGYPMHLAKRKIGSRCARRKPACQCLLPCQAAKSAAQRLEGMALASARGSSLKAREVIAGFSPVKMAFTLEHVAIACGAFGVIAGIVSFGFLGIVLCLAFHGSCLAVGVRNAWLYRYPAQVVCSCALAATIWWDDESGGSAAVNRLPPLALSALLSSGVMIGQRRALRREDDLWGSFLTGFLVTAAPAAVVTVLGFVKCFFDICRNDKEPSGKKRA
ncbi:unnamed protein product [Symbiodinium sp. CCMP2592]|nr:unnamed protein product [Symbiodinium sp. CCMP2592]